MYGLYARKHHIIEMRGDVTDAGQTPEQLKIELLSQWKLEAESRNFKHCKHVIQGAPHLILSYPIPVQQHELQLDLEK